ncbi:MAG TPA: sugar ABC transporter permease [Armatimonadota bacterium]|nr:sugar ABC transporter permease [Armatimonadota bacterium]HQK95309.1 sugar ABC transporter permease [Armatimonadota bacterium]
MARPATRQLLQGLGFCSPSIIGLAALMAYPMAASLYYSFCNYSVLRPARFIGTANYRHLLTEDELFRTALYNTAVYAVWAVPLGIVFAFVLALLLNVKVRGMAFYRTIFFIPSIVPLVASSVLWIWLLNPQIGGINFLLDRIGVDGLLTRFAETAPATARWLGFEGGRLPGWLSDPQWAKRGIILWSIWGVGGSVVIYLAGLQGVPKELYEAAEVDGAGAWHRVRHITVPFMTPYLFFTLVMGLIGAFQFFTPAYVMTNGQGGPVDSTTFYSLYLFNVAFADFKMGYASAMAWILFAIIVVGTVLVFKTSARFVYYGEGAGEGR